MIKYMVLAKRILRHVKGTLDHGLVYENREAGLKLVGYSDSDYAGHLDDKKSIIGMTFFLGKNLICWASKKRSWRYHHVQPSMLQPLLQLIKEYGKQD